MSCRVSGFFFGDAIWGFAAKTGTVGVPVLEGNITPAISALCVCERESDLDLDAAVCTDGKLDGSTSS
jgi:hypothetical protein